MSSKIRIEYSYWNDSWDSYRDDSWGKSSGRSMSRGFDNIEKAAGFIQSLSVNRKSLKLLVNGKEFNWPEDTSDEEVLRKHLEYCLDFIEAFYE